MALNSIKRGLAGFLSLAFTTAVIGPELIDRQVVTPFLASAQDIGEGSYYWAYTAIHLGRNPGGQWRGFTDIPGEWGRSLSTAKGDLQKRGEQIYNGTYYMFSDLPRLR